MDENEWPASMEIHGAEAVARQALTFYSPAAQLQPVLVNCAAGVVVTEAGRPVAVMGFTVAEGRIVEVDVIVEPERVRRVAAAVVSTER